MSHVCIRSARFAAVGLIMLTCSCAGDRIIGVGDRIHHDDFEYRVTNYTTTDSIGPGANVKRAAGRFYLVAFEVENRAARVSHEWGNSIAYLVDEEGRKYENLPEVQSALNEQAPFNLQPRHSTPAGSTEATTLVFDLPAEARQPCLFVRGSLLMGDVFDGKAFERTKVRLY